MTSTSSPAPTAAITLHGQVDAAAQDLFTSANTEAERTNPSASLLKFTAVTLFFSILACGLSAHDREVFTITRLADFILIFHDEQSALPEVGKASS